MHDISLYIALKFIRAQTASSTLTFITKLFFVSIIISTAALALIASIMQGCHQTTVSTLQGISPDLIITAPGNYINADKITSIISQKFPHHIASIMPCNFYHALVQHPRHTHDFSHVTLLAAVDPRKAHTLIPFIFSTVCQKHHHSINNLQENTVIIGKALADDLKLECGDTLLIRYPEDDTHSTETLIFSTTKARIVGLFQSGVTEWDERVIYVSLDFAHQLFHDDNLTQQLHIKLSPQASLPEIQQLLHQSLHLSVRSWYDMNPALVSALHLEKYAMLAILVLIILIAGVTTASLLCMQLAHHTHTIAVLAACGLSFQKIMRIFITYGVLITLIATLCGLSLATILSYFIDHYQLIRLPDIYYATHVPAKMSWSIALIILGITLTVSYIAAWYPTRKIRSLPLAHTLANV